MNGTIQISITQLIIALVGASAISGIVTGLILALSQWRERKSRREELLFTKAIEMAFKHTETRMQMAEKSKSLLKVIPEIVSARFFHKQLQLLIEKGRLSDDMEKEFHNIINRVPPELRMPNNE